MIQKKILLLLFGGYALGCSALPSQQFKIIKTIGEAWKDIDQQSLRRAIRSLYESKLVSAKEHKNGSTTIILSLEGKKKVLTYQIDEMRINKPKKWDRKWRIILFDIPEKIRKARDVFRYHLNQLGFYEFQKSVFVHPYNCKDEIDYLIEFYNLRRFVRFVEADSIDNELHLKKYFHLLEKADR
ncbi:MAG: hypothetical protein UU71_C0004G0014 [Parcubacteria group bacterium GW2011_GWB1_41_6]|nr:MAG: hypothetical protein UU71_C0004G0014 [Parcubacteria group bacterium GW2011_GWB1_41_6]KKS33935.1 MAG: hypothetical protein UU96_C0011G0013 [Parcubacteria group bacterium GW2011_GWC2_42_13]KKS56615.1 MAG: hypothetical protein UV22_C0028G0004 [Parcubacteria group bacterium GW2011_GWA2_42_35]